MAKFDDLFLASAAPVLWDMFADSMSYTSPDATTTALSNVMVGEEVEAERETDAGLEVFKSRIVSCIVDSAHAYYCGVTAIAVNGTATISGLDYAIADVTPRGDDIIDATLVRVSPRSQARHGHWQGSSLTRRN